MLGKLFKYEMKSTARIFLPFFGVILLMSIINRVSMAIFSSNDVFGIPRALLIIMYVFVIIAAFVTCLITTILRFYKNLLGAEGYLMFTLPVSPSANILAKFFASFLWMLSTLAVTLLSIFIVLPDYSWMSDIGVFWSEFRREAQNTIGINAGLLVTLLLILIVVAFISFILQAYVSISIGQLSNNHKLLVSFGAFICIYLVLQIIMIIGLSVIGYGLYDQIQSWNSLRGNPTFIGGFILSVFILQICVDAIASVAYFMASRHLLGKKLNLE